jgi:hypothetical protein
LKVVAWRRRCSSRDRPSAAPTCFALDSIPAAFGVTDEPFIVFAANAFALLGLRALYFHVTGLLDRLVYLSTGLSLILAFIGVKLLLHYGHLRNADVPEIATSTSLLVIVAVLAVTIVASLLKARRDPGARAHAGSLREAESAVTRRTRDRTARRRGRAAHHAAVETPDRRARRLAAGSVCGPGNESAIPSRSVPESVISLAWRRPMMRKARLRTSMAVVSRTSAMSPTAVAPSSIVAIGRSSVSSRAEAA